MFVALDAEKKPFSRTFVAHIRNCLILALLFAGSFFLSKNWLYADIEKLVTLMPDDSFYYFRIAQNFCNGKGLTFDGENVATGLHVLWLIAIQPFFCHVEPGAIEPVRNVLIFGILLGCIAGFQVYRFTALSQDNFCRWCAVLIAICCSWNIYFLSEILNGLETALSLCLISSFALYVFIFLRTPTLKHSLLLALLGAANFWARSDSLVCLGFLYLLLLVRTTKRELLIPVFVAPIVSVVTMIGYNLVATGQPLQSSALALPWVIHNNWLFYNPGAEWKLFSWFGGSLFISEIQLTFGNLGRPGTQIAAVAIPLIIGSLLIWYDRLSVEARLACSIALAMFWEYSPFSLFMPIYDGMQKHGILCQL